MSSIIKSPYTNTVSTNKRVIALKPLHEAMQIEEEEILEEEQEEIIDLEEYKAEADAIIKKAEEEAVVILQDAESKLQEIMHQIELEKEKWDIEKEHWIQTAKEEGYQKGVELGQQDGFNEYQSLIQIAKETIQLSKVDYHKNVEQAEWTILQLAISSAEKIMGYTLDSNPDAFIHLVKKVMKEVKDHQDVQIHVHPINYELVLAHKEELNAYFNHPTTEVYIYPDDELMQTDCIIESSFGRIEASIDTQLQELKTKLLQLLEGETEDEGSQFNL